MRELAFGLDEEARLAPLSRNAHELHPHEGIIHERRLGGRQDELASIGRPIEIVHGDLAAGDQACLACLHIHDVEANVLVIAIGDDPIPPFAFGLLLLFRLRIGDGVGDAPPIGRPAEHENRILRSRERTRFAPIGREEINLRVRRGPALREECDPASVGRPLRCAIALVIVGEATRLAARRRHQPDLAERRARPLVLAARAHDLKGDLPPIGRQLHLRDPSNAQDQLRRQDLLLSRNRQGEGEEKKRDETSSEPPTYHRFLLRRDVAQALCTCGRWIFSSLAQKWKSERIFFGPDGLSGRTTARIIRPAIKPRVSGRANASPRQALGQPAAPPFPKPPK
ncbi:hypothetical protein HRbin08_01598 [bacterium HR08]|nr:hypothetical protein HRbin08_01598 [bacterium HR08]